MRTIGWVLGSALTLLSPSLWAVQSVLPAGTTSQFSSMLDQIKSGAAGSAISDADIEVQRDHVVMKLKRRGKGSESVVLTRPNETSLGSRAKYFALTAGPAVSKADLSSLVGLLDSNFPSDPWVTVLAPGENPVAALRVGNPPAPAPTADHALRPR